MHNHDYSTKTRKWEAVAMILAFALLAAAICLNLFVRDGIEPDAVYQMTDQRITWEGAGYSGIYGRD